MRPRIKIRLELAGWAVAAVLMAHATTAVAADWRGAVDLEYRWFADDALDPRQVDDNLAASFEPEFNHSWNDGSDSFTFRPFFRIDQHDDERTHFDIRELTWIHAADEWELRVGIRKEFWGVTEGQHLVDIINQSDQVEGHARFLCADGFSRTNLSGSRRPAPSRTVDRRRSDNF